MQHQNILDGAVALEETWDGSTMSGVSIPKNGFRRLSEFRVQHFSLSWVESDMLLKETQ